MRRPGFSLLGVLLAFAAILGVFALSGWHSAMVNDADPVHAVSVDHHHAVPDKDDPDAPIHVVAHATASFLSIAASPLASVMAEAGDGIWAPLVAFFRDGSDPSGLLRPPQG